MKTCPKCKLASPDEASRCDCGYDFGTKKIEKSYSAAPNELSPEQLAAIKYKANSWLAICILLLALHTVLFLGGGGATIPANLIALIYLFCCCRYALCKGYRWMWGLWGLMSFLGLALLVSKPYKAGPDKAPGARPFTL